PARRPGGWLLNVSCDGVSRLPVPVREAPQIRIPPREIVALEAVRYSRDGVAPHDRNHDDVLGEHVVHADEQGGTLGRVHLALGGLPDPIVLLVPPARGVAS